MSEWELFLDEEEDHHPRETVLPSLHDGFTDPGISSPVSRSMSPTWAGTLTEDPITPPQRSISRSPIRSVTRPVIPAYVDVRFHEKRHQIVKNTVNIPISVGDYILTEADRGVDLGQVIATDIKVADREAAGLKAVVRKASQHEIATLPGKLEREIRAREVCQAKAEELNLPMTITATEFQYDGKKLTVYFCASQYIDFRDLVHILFRYFGTRIWMVWYDGEAPVRDVFTHSSPVDNMIPVRA